MKTILSKTVLSTVAMLSLGIASLTSTENQKDHLYNGHFDQKHESQPVIDGNPTLETQTYRSVRYLEDLIFQQGALVGKAKMSTQKR